MENHDYNSSFAKRHIGISPDEIQEMLNLIGETSIESLINNTIPKHILHDDDLGLDVAKTEQEVIQEMKQIASKNKVFKSYIGQGYYNTFTPTVIQRNILENPGWYTQYTPYQAEISQGRMEALINFQTMVCDLTGMDISNASLLDEATAAAEAMTLLYRSKKNNDHRNLFFVDENCFQQTIDVIKTRAESLEIDLKIANINEFDSENCYAVLVQYPNSKGEITDYSDFVTKCHSENIKVVFAVDLLALTLLKSPAEFSVDVVIGSSQRLGVPLFYGGPHASFMACKDEFKRQMPGRIIGVSKDKFGKPAYRMALQTREQHIRRDKATSNICTAQALLAITASMYAVYHGKEGLKSIAEKIHNLTILLNDSLINSGFNQKNKVFFDTLFLTIADNSILESIKINALNHQINFYYTENNIGISIDETTTFDDIKIISSIFAEAKNQSFKLDFTEKNSIIPENLIRKTDFLTHPVFSQHQSETKLLRYMKRLENKDLSLTLAMIPLGSCTMKLNATTEMLPLSWNEIAQIHPFVPLNQAEGYTQIFTELEDALNKVTGLDACSLQPNSGAQGEYAGILAIKKYLESINQTHRKEVFIPSSAHGTNPATATMLGLNVVIIKCDEEGNIDLNDLNEKLAKYKDTLAALMVTYPSTHGVFEESIVTICELIHQNGGQVYMDGANMNAQVGLTSPGFIGADVCHLNLHKTFSIPHGGGGPGVGPICVKSHLKPFLPGHSIVNIDGRNQNAVSATPWGSASILTISYAYIKLLGEKGVRNATEIAILNANYIKARLENYFPVLYQGTKNRVAHELILDIRGFKKTTDVEVEDIAKRLIDYGFHSPTMSWPVTGTLMVEPTESEDKQELDRFCDAMISIWNEIQEIENGTFDKVDNVLKNAPHTCEEIASNNWNHAYSRQKAVFPMANYNFKYWSPVSRIDNPYGDKNLFCACIPIE